jgi:hypothetical protein
MLLYAEGNELAHATMLASSAEVNFYYNALMFYHLYYLFYNYKIILQFLIFAGDVFV